MNDLIKTGYVILNGKSSSYFHIMLRSTQKDSEINIETRNN